MKHEPQPVAKVRWRRMAAALAAVVTAMSVIRLAGDAAGVLRGTTASHVLSAASWFVLMIAVQVALPWVLPGVFPKDRTRQRLYRVTQIAAVSAMLMFLVLSAG